jgi:transposase InsO family protein
MTMFIDEHRDVFGVGPICKVLPIAPSTYYEHKTVEHDPDLASDRAKRDKEHSREIKRVFDASGRRYGARKVWHALRRENHDIARCTVERIMKAMGLQGVVRGKPPITTTPDTSQPCPDDRVNREFVAQKPNQLWVSDFTYVSSWQGTVYVAFVIDVFARKIVGWRVSTSMTTQFALDALNQAICQRMPSEAGLVHHSDRGSQYLSIRYTERLAEEGIDPSVGSVGDSYDNALAESVIGLFKTEVINFLGPWKSMGQVEWQTLKWVAWYNAERLHSAINYMTPNEAENAFYANLNADVKAA